VNYWNAAWDILKFASNMVLIYLLIEWIREMRKERKK
jgi:hypothetical protein